MRIHPFHADFHWRVMHDNDRRLIVLFGETRRQPRGAHLTKAAAVPPIFERTRLLYEYVELTPSNTEFFTSLASRADLMRRVAVFSMVVISTPRPPKVCLTPALIVKGGGSIFV